MLLQFWKTIDYFKLIRCLLYNLCIYLIKMAEYSFKLAPYCTLRICLVLKPDHNNNYGYTVSSK